MQQATNNYKITFRWQDTDIHMDGWAENWNQIIMKALRTAEANHYTIVSIERVDA